MKFYEVIYDNRYIMFAENEEEAVADLEINGYGRPTLRPLRLDELDQEALEELADHLEVEVEDLTEADYVSDIED